MSACGLGTTSSTRTTLWYDFRSSHLRWSGSLRARSCRPAASERLPPPAPRCGTTFGRLICGGPVHCVPGLVGLRPRNNSLHPHHVVVRLSVVSPAVVRFTACPIMSACGLGTTPSTCTTLWYDFRSSHLRWSGSLRAWSCLPAASEQLPPPAPRCARLPIVFYSSCRLFSFLLGMIAMFNFRGLVTFYVPF
jgi:hypothetical protein